MLQFRYVHYMTMYKIVFYMLIEIQDKLYNRTKF